MTTALQSMGFAISPAGLQALFSEAIGPQIATQLETTLAPPPYTMPPPTPTWSIEGTTPQGPPSGVITSYYDYVLNLTNGVFTTFAPVFASYSQSGNQFTVTLLAAQTVVTYDWSETWTQTVQAGWKKTTTNGQWSGPYAQSFASFEIQVTLALNYTASTNEFSIAYVSSITNPGTESASIPAGSILNSAPQDGCSFSQTVQGQTELALSNIEFGPTVAGNLASYLYEIPATGELGGGVAFAFSPTPGVGSPPPPSGSFTFPGDGGVTGGVTGDVTYGQQSYSSVITPPAAVSIPDVPSDYDVAYNVEDYAFNGLFWGCTAAGLLDVTLGATEVGAGLETKTYHETWPPLYEIWPSADMTAVLAPIAPATVTFQIVYQLNATNLPEIENALGPTVWSQVGSALEGIEGTYITQSGFEWQLANADSALVDYESTIEEYAAIAGVVVSQDLDVELNVVSTNPTPGVGTIIFPPGSGTSIPTPANPILTFTVSAQWVMLDVGLAASTSAAAQSLTFTLQTPADYDIFPQTTFIQSTIPDTNSGTWPNIWQALAQEWQNAMTAVGAQGVALPRFAGFDFDMSSSVVEIEVPAGGGDGYVAVTANATFSST